LRDFNAALYGKLYVDEFTKSVLLTTKTTESTKIHIIQSAKILPVCLQSPEIILLLINLARWMLRGGFLLESIPGKG
jgi:hypothetical protein